MEKAIVCFSGGHASALTAIEAVRKYGKERVILLNHDISSHVEHADIKRFKYDVADYLDLPITYANMPEWETKGPLNVCMDIKAFKVDNGTALCTNRLKTEPFKKWLKLNYPVPGCEKDGTWYETTHPNEMMNEDIKILYGFDRNEHVRITRRVGILSTMGYYSDYPIALWERTIEQIEDIGIKRPITYRLYKHANCIGCLKAGRQHWYCVYCLRPDIWEEAKLAESEIGYSIIKDIYLEELETKFKEMRDEKGICPSEKMNSATFWAEVERRMPGETTMFPCDCAI